MCYIVHRLVQKLNRSFCGKTQKHKPTRVYLSGGRGYDLFMSFSQINVSNNFCGLGLSEGMNTCHRAERYSIDDDQEILFQKRFRVSKSVWR